MTSTLTIPDFSSLPAFDHTGMTNYDHSIEDGFEAHLRAGGWGRHAAWEFNGLVWFADGQFHEQVWRHHNPRGVISADTLQELMNAVNDEYGWE